MIRRRYSFVNAKNGNVMVRFYRLKSALRFKELWKDTSLTVTIQYRRD